MVEVNWSRQLIILVLAAVFAFYWTGKQGLWDALRGSSPWDKDWADAKAALQKRVSNRAEMIPILPKAANPRQLAKERARQKQ